MVALVSCLQGRFSGRALTGTLDCMSFSSAYLFILQLLRGRTVCFTKYHNVPMPLCSFSFEFCLTLFLFLYDHKFLKNSLRVWDFPEDIFLSCTHKDGLETEELAIFSNSNICDVKAHIIVDIHLYWQEIGAISPCASLTGMNLLSELRGAVLQTSELPFYDDKLSIIL